MLQRSLTALVGIPVVVAAVWLGAPWLTVLALVAGVVGVWELYRMTPASVGPLPVFLGSAWVVALLLGAQAASGRDNFLIISGGVAAAGSFASLLWFIAFYKNAKNDARSNGASGFGSALAGFSYLLGGPLYVGFLLAHALVLWEITASGITTLEPVAPGGNLAANLGRDWLLCAVLITFATDTGAYLVGRAVGSRPMAPSVSPNKTWEGALGGFVLAVAAALILGLVFDLGIAVWQLAVTGGVVGVVAQWGDLIVSKLKRIADVKDTGSIIPGHGGLLDRLDSMLLALPAVYYLLVTVFVP